jgi:hypothetical protein
MDDRDWAAEARRLLDEAAGANDNGADAAYLRQRRTLLDRLHGYLVAQGAPVEAAFRSEIRRLFGRDSLDAMDDGQLAELLSRFDQTMRMARLVAATSAGRG